MISRIGKPGFLAFLCAAFSAAGCNSSGEPFGQRAADVVALSDTGVNGCAAVSGNPWVPNVAGVSPSHHDSNVQITKQVLTATGKVTGYSQAPTEVSVTIDMSQDLGPMGSLSLVAEVTQAPGAYTGSVYPMLVYLSDGVVDYINLARSGAAGDCKSSGFYSSCGSSGCQPNSGCKIQWPSAYFDRGIWEQHQIAIFGTESVNTFPTCNWTGGSAPPSTSSACAFNAAPIGTGGASPLRTGTYIAKYVLITPAASSVAAGDATVKVTAIKKKSTRAVVGGAVDLNVVLVGSKNIAASRTDKGRQNLDLLFTEVWRQYSQATVGVKLGSIRVFEWGCEQGGEAYAAVDISNIGTLFARGSAMLPADGEGKALNIFLVSSFTASGIDENLEIAGLAGGIGGPMLNGYEASGLAFASFNKLDTFNPGCSVSSCPLASQEWQFVDMGSTIAHEMGHYLGLNHPSESEGTVHDVVYDTPICTAKKSGAGYITNTSCAVTDTSIYAPTGKKCSEVCAGYNPGNGIFCPEKLECQFNHTMWWFSKYFLAGEGDGTIFSQGSGKIINYNPFIQ